MQQYQHGLEQQGRLEERERLGHDLHDGILQSPYAIGLSLETCKPYLSEAPDKANDILFLSADELNSVMREVRIFVEKLEVAKLPETALPALDLPASVRTIAGTLARLHGQQIRVSVDPAAASGLSHAQSLQIRNLVKEAISNSPRHAGGHWFSSHLVR